MIIGMRNVHKGDRFGNLTVIAELAVGLNKKSRLVSVKCDCGNLAEVRRDKLRSGWTKSCGCLTVKHGHTVNGVKDPTYRAWNNIMTRTSYVGSKEFKYHGAMGVEACGRWRDNFISFLEDMGEKPEWATGGIDRIDPWGHYSCGKCPECKTNNWPANCRWSTQKEQMRNTRKNNPK